MILAEGAWRMRQPSKKPERKKGRPKKKPKQQQKLLLAKRRTRPELPESWRKRRKKELCQAKWDLAVFHTSVASWKKMERTARSTTRRKLHSGAIAAEWQRRRLCSLSIQAQYFSKTSQDSREGKDSCNKASNERQYPIHPWSSFFQAQRPESKLDGRCKMARKMKELVPASGISKATSRSREKEGEATSQRPRPRKRRGRGRKAHLLAKKPLCK